MWRRYEVNISPDDQEQVIDGQTCTCTFRALRPGIYYSLGLRAKNQLGWGSIANVIVRTDCKLYCTWIICPTLN